MKTVKIRSMEKLGETLNEENYKDLMICFSGAVMSFLEIRKKHPKMKFTGFNWRNDKINDITGIEVTERYLIKIKRNPLPEDKT